MTRAPIGADPSDPGAQSEIDLPWRPNAWWLAVAVSAVLPFGFFLLFSPIPQLSIFIFVALVVVLYPLTLLPSLWLALWTPTARHLSRSGDELQLTWWSLGSARRRIPLGAIRQIEVMGRTLRILERGRRPLVLRLPARSRREVEDWVQSVAGQLDPEQGSEELSVGLDRAVVQTSHDALRLEIRPVFAPVSPWLVLLSLPFAWIFVHAALHFSPDVLSPGAALGLALLCDGVFASWVIYGLSAQLHATEIALVGARLEVTERRRWWRSKQTFPLADLDSVRESHGALVLKVSGALVRIPLPPRSSGTVQALRHLLDEHVRRAEPLRGEVPQELSRLLRQPE